MLKYHIPEYMIAICPSQEIVLAVAKLKQELYKTIGWFGSYNSLAHLTIEPFNADEEMLNWRKELFKVFASTQRGHIIRFNSIDRFDESRTIFAAPDNDSEHWLNDMVKQYSKMLSPPSTKEPRFKAHLTIGRGIDYKKFEAAKNVFANQEIQMSFACNNIALRKFNYEHKQYDIVARYYFGNN